MSDQPEIVWIDGERCVLKRLPPARAAAADARHLALLDALSRVSHAHLARVVAGGVNRDGERVRWLATRFVEGTSAKDVVARGGLPPDRTLAVLQAASRGLEHLHAGGVVHRDIAPGNVILRVDGGAVLIDFGNAVLTGRPLPYSAGIVGTPGYVAPEVVVRGAAAVTPAVDIYGLAAVGYALLTGGAPAQGEDLLDTVAGAARPPPRPRDLGVDVSDDFEATLLEALAPDPVVRPDAATLVAALAALDGQAGPGSSA